MDTYRIEYMDSNLTRNTVEIVSDSPNRARRDARRLLDIRVILTVTTLKRYDSCSCDRCEATGGTNNPDH